MKENNNIENVEIVESKSPKKKFIIIIGLIVAVVIIGIILYINYPFTEKQKDDKIVETYWDKGRDEAIELSIKYYGESDKTLGWIQAFSEIENGDVIDQLTKVEQNLKKDGSFYDYNLTLKNESDKTITYIKYNVYLYDENENIIHSDWSNWSGKLLPDAQIKMDTMIDYIPGVEKFSYEIEDITVE